MAAQNLGPLLTGKYAWQAGFRGNGLVMAIAVAGAESGYDVVAVGTNKDGSKDRGLWQINNRWHPEVSDAMAFDPATAAVQAFRISVAGTSWGAWSTYNNGAYKTHMAEAQKAADSLAVNPNPQGDVGAAVPGIGVPGAQFLPGPLGGNSGLLNNPALITSPLDAAKTALELAGKAAAWVAQRHNWIRVLEVLGGLVGLVVALELISSDVREATAGAAALAA